MTEVRSRDPVHPASIGLEELPTDQAISRLLGQYDGTRMVITTSFGMEGCVLVDLLGRTGASLDIVYLDTGFFFPETYAVRDRLADRYPQLRMVNRGTGLTPEAQEQRHGPALWLRDPDRCCQLRRVEPMAQALVGAELWMTSITRQQSEVRATTPLLGWDERFGLLKACPLVRWDRAAIWEYVQRERVPYNPLHERGYPTVGCVQCTTPVANYSIGQYSRDGRWAGIDKTECGLHDPTQRVGEG